MKHLIRIVLFTIVVAFAACGDNRFDRTLCSLDSVLRDKPDSVYELLLGMEEEAATQKKASRMYYELLRADAQNKAYVDFTTDSVMKIVADYYDRHGSANEQMRAHYLLGCTYRDLKDVPMELQCFQDAVEKADTTQKDCDWGRMASIYGQMANIYHYQYLPEEELKALSKCEHYSIKNHDDYGSIKAYELRMRAYLIMNMPDTVLDITNKSRELYKEIGCQKEAARLLCPAIGMLLDRGEYEKAKAYMDDFEENSGYFNDNGEIDSCAALFLHTKGLYALHINKIDSAKYYFYRLLDFNEREAAYQGLLSVYGNTGQADSVLKYSRLYTIANDSNFFSKNSEVIAQMTAMYDYNRHKEVAMKNLMEAKSAKEVAFWLALVVAVLWFLAIFVGVIINNRNKEKEREFQLLFKRLSDTKAMVEELEAEKAELEATKTLSSEQAEKLVALQSELQAYKEETRQLVEKVHRTKAPEKPVDFDSWLEEFRRNRAIEELRSFVRTPKPGERDCRQS